MKSQWWFESFRIGGARGSNCSRNFEQSTLSSTNALMVHPPWIMCYVKQVKNELPSTFKAFRFQQHRWSCGPASLFRKVFPQVLKNKVSKPLDSFMYQHLVSIYWKIISPCRIKVDVKMWRCDPVLCIMVNKWKFSQTYISWGKNKLKL
jgi:hypothetical protein